MRHLVLALCLLATPALADDPILPPLTPGAVLPNGRPGTHSRIHAERAARLR